MRKLSAQIQRSTKGQRANYRGWFYERRDEVLAVQYGHNFLRAKCNRQTEPPLGLLLAFPSPSIYFILLVLPLHHSKRNANYKKEIAKIKEGRGSSNKAAKESLIFACEIAYTSPLAIQTICKALRLESESMASPFVGGRAV